ncbi:MAG: type II toxin-antitoxin system VapC family toxin [Spirochaetales bacterium]|nr:type II toxin-antitoxin system VapC family toxin [Spirochaetales bacterium]
MIIILDTSAAIDLLLSKGNFEIYKSEIEKADTVIAPEIYLSEITNVAWKYNKIAGFTHEESLNLAEDGINLIDQFIPVKDLWKESLREAINNDHPVYDCLYMVCARRNDGILLSKDKKLKKMCEVHKVQTL